jgi:iron complex outermembrane receptor protein
MYRSERVVFLGILLIGMWAGLGVCGKVMASETAPSMDSRNEAAPASSDSEDHGHAHGAHDETYVPAEARERVYSFGLDELVVTASPLPRKASEIAGAVSTLKGRELLQKQQPTLGETIKNLPGVSATYYGPGASRPILRGLGGSRVRILQDNLAVIDASAASNDHAVAMDTFGLSSIEILRGPATLRFGPNAVGGVVNAIEDRIPQKLGDEEFSGSAELRGSSVDGGFGGAAILRGTSGKLAWRAKGFGFSAGNVNIPGYAESSQLRASEEEEGQLHEEEEGEAFDTLPNSQVEFTGFSAGASWIDEHFYMGMAPSYYQTNYGVIFHEHEGEEHGGEDDHEEDDHDEAHAEEPPVTIAMESWSLDFRGGLTDVTPQIHSIDLRLRLTDYRHSELEGQEAATTFANRGYDLRLELVHERMGLWEGAIGYQSTYSDFQVSGEEAFLPNTRSSMQSLFVIEEIDLAPVVVELGGRFDYSSVASSGGNQFGNARTRDFPGGSVAVGVVWDATDEQLLSFDGSWTSRAPNYEELFAEGVHVASGFYERGNAGLTSENAVGLNLGWVGRYGDWVDWSANAFYDRFWDFIFLQGTGELEDGAEVGQFLATDAAFVGGELELAGHVLDRGGHRLHVIGRADYVHAQNLTTDQPLPRIPPLRFGGSLVYEYETFRAELDVMRAMQQDRAPKGEWATEGYTMLDLGVSYEVDLGMAFEPLIFVRVSNMLNVEARDAASFLRDLAPLPGRNFSVGMQVKF